MDLISVVITTYNRYDYLIKAIDSVLLQNYSNIQIIVVDDNSTADISKKISEIEGILYVRNNFNLGASESRKKGFELAEGKYVIFMDDDDFYLDSNFFSKCVEQFDNHKKANIVFVSGNANLFIDEDKKIVDGYKLNFIGFVENTEYLSGFQYNYAKPYSTFTTIFLSEMVKDKIIPEINMFNDSIIYIKALMYGNAWFLEDVIGAYRIHKSNISKNLNLDFLIQNLVEKYKVSTMMNDNFKINPNLWLFYQFQLTCDYYMRESFPTLKKNIILLKWVIKHLYGLNYKMKFIKLWTVNIIYELRVSLKKDGSKL